MKTNVVNVAPQLRKPIPDVYGAPGGELQHEFDVDTFIDADPGDVLTLSANLATGEPLPSWVRFDPDSRRFHGRVPKTSPPERASSSTTLTKTKVDGQPSFAGGTPVPLSELIGAL